MLQLKLLSKPSIKIDDSWQPLPKGKTSALLYYLGYHNDWVSRDELLYLFWPDTAYKQARSNLRTLLSRTTGKLDYISLETNNDKIRWQINSDIGEFRQAIEANNIGRSIELYTGELLAGYYCDGAFAFEEWLNQEREEVLRLYKENTKHFIDKLLIDKDYSRAAKALNKVLEQDPLDENSFRSYLEAIFLSEGQLKAEHVLNEYQAFLSKELNSNAEERTLRLFNDLCTGASQTMTTTAVAIKSVDKILHNLPLKLKPFIGRKKERDELAKRLSDPIVRLITIVAPGGMGKTRLSITVAEEHIGTFRDGIWFVPFEALDSSDNIVFQIAEALNFQFFGQDDSKTQLLNYLKEKELLLITDNLEHILEGIAILSELLEHSPTTKILATSREVLDLQAEYVYELSGLKLESIASETSEAAKLFVQCIDQVDKDFELNESNTLLIETICELVAGMPLALELAASWFRLLSLEDIVEELSHSIDILASQSRDRPDRQQSIRAIFDYSWSLLSTQEQDVVIKLAIFHKGFDQRAAKEITEVGVPILLGLCKKSFIHKAKNNRYSQHPLMWQYVREKFSHLETSKLLKENHANYYLTFVKKLPDPSRILEPQTVLNKITNDFANIQTAWNFAVEYQHASLIGESSFNLIDFFIYTNRLEEGKAFFESALKEINNNSINQANLYAALGQLHGTDGTNHEAVSNLQKGIDIYSKHDVEDLRLRALFFQAINFFLDRQPQKGYETLVQSKNLAEKIENDFFFAWATSQIAMGPQYKADETIFMFRESISMLKVCDGYFPLTWTQNDLANYLNNFKGAYDEAFEVINEAITLELKRGWKSNLASFLVTRVRICLSLGKLNEAKQTAQEILVLTEGVDLGFLRWVVDYTYYLLAKVDFLNADYDSAQTNLFLALEALKKRGNEGEEFVRYNCDLAQVAIATGDIETAQSYREKVQIKLEQSENQHSHYIIHKLYLLETDLAIIEGDIINANDSIRKAVDIIYQNEELPNLLTIFLKYGQVLILENNTSLATSFIYWAGHHSSSNFETKQLATKLQSDYHLKVSNPLDFDKLVTTLCTL